MDNNFIDISELKEQVSNKELEHELALTIKLLQDADTGEFVDVTEILNPSDETEKFQIRHTLVLAQKSGIFKYKCAECGEPVRLLRRRYNNQRQETWFFAHFKNNGVPCPIKTENVIGERGNISISASLFSESSLHIDLIHRLDDILSKDRSFSNTLIKPFVRDIALLDNGRKPDVTAIYQNKEKVIFEFQLFHTLVDTILDRKSFYRIQGHFLIWLFPYFSANSLRMCEKDIFYTGRRNVFVFDREEYYINEQFKVKDKGAVKPPFDEYKFAQEESIESGKLMLNCYWQIPQSLEDGKGFKMIWKHKLISFEDLIWDKNTYELYYYDAEKEYYDSLNNEEKNRYEYWRNEQEKRIEKIFNNVQLIQEKKKKQEQDREAVRIRKEKIERFRNLYEQAKQNQIKPIAFQENGMWGFRIEEFITVKPKYNEIKAYNQGITCVKMSFWGCIDLLGKKVVNCQYKELIHTDDIIIACNKSGHWGCFSLNGEEIIPFEYNRMCEFGKNRIKAKKGYGYGIIDHHNEVIIPFEYDDISGFFGERIKVNKYGKCGIIDFDNNIIIPFEYDSIGDFIEGRAIVTKNNVSGIIDESGNVLPSSVSVLSNGLLKGEKFHEWGVYSSDGIIIIPFEYERIGDFINDRIIVKQNNRCGVLNSKGEEIIPFEYEGINILSVGKIKAKKYGWQGKYGILNWEGKELIPFEYDSIGDFIEGRAIVTKNNVSGFIDESGNVLPSSVSVLSNGLLKGEKFLKWGVYTSDDIIIPFEYDEIGDFVDGKIQVRKKKDVFSKDIFSSVGFIDELGNILPSNVSVLSNGLLKGEKFSQWGVYTSEGTTVIPFEYYEIDDFVDNMIRVRTKNTIQLHPTTDDNDWICFDSEGHKIGSTINMFKQNRKYEGIIKKILSYGILINIPHRKIGLLHISEIEKCHKGLEEFKEGDKIIVKVKYIDRTKNRIAFGLPKNIENIPYKCGEKYIGKIINSESFGLFVRVENHQIGLVHKSELIRIGKNISDYCIGDFIEVTVLSIDEHRNRVNFSLSENEKQV